MKLSILMATAFLATVICTSATFAGSQTALSKTLPAFTPGLLQTVANKGDGIARAEEVRVKMAIEVANKQLMANPRYSKLCLAPLLKKRANPQ